MRGAWPEWKPLWHWQVGLEANHPILGLVVFHRPPAYAMMM